MSKPQKIIIDDVEYVRADSIKPQTVTDKVIIRTESAGVHYGVIESRDGSEVTLLDSRRIWYWDGACSLSQLAVDGTKKPENCKFSVVVPRITILGVVEIIPCTLTAATIINGVAAWKK